MEVTHKGAPIRLAADFSMEMFQARKKMETIDEGQEEMRIQSLN